MIKKIINTIQKHDTFCILYHKSPDGDAIGSALALYYFLEKLGKKAYIYSRDRVPLIYKFLPGSEFIVHSATIPDADVTIFLECSDIERSAYSSRQINSKVIINIDHHEKRGDYGYINWVDPTMSSVAQQIYYIYKNSDVEIDKNVAICLYTGIMTDTGRFQYTNMKPELYGVIAELVKKGIEVNKVYSEIYGKKRKSYLKLLGHVFSNMEFFKDDTICISYVTNKQFKNCGATLEDLDGVTEILRDIEDTEVSVLLKELEDNVVKISFRSIGNVRVDQIASKYNGGGHKFASGCRIRGDLEKAKNIILEELEEII